MSAETLLFWIIIVLFNVLASRRHQPAAEEPPTYKEAYNLLFSLNRHPCPFCGGVVIESVRQARILGLNYKAIGDPCFHLVVNSEELDKVYEACFP